MAEQKDFVCRPSNDKQIFSQQKVASQLPRGTRVDSTGTRLEVKGARNYTPNSLHIGTDEIFEDIVIRGLRADGLSSKLGVRNNREGIGKLIDEVFQNDVRRSAVLSHFNSKRQRSNAAKTVFATMTQEELKIILQELIPVKVDLQIRHRLCKSFIQQKQKLNHCVDVLKHLQQSFSNLDHLTELLSLHNFQSRGFFADILCSITNFLLQVVEDASNHTGTPNYDEKVEKSTREVMVNIDRTKPCEFATLPLPQKLKPDQDHMSYITKQPGTSPEETFDDIKNWASLEVVDADGHPKYFLIRTPKQENGSLDTNKLIQLLNEQSGMIGNPSTPEISSSDVRLSSYPLTTLEISLQTNEDNVGNGKRPHCEEEYISAKRTK